MLSKQINEKKNTFTTNINNRMHLFVTVGTTQFDQLTSSVQSEQFLDFIVQRKFTKLTIQYGSKGRQLEQNHSKHLKIKMFDFEPSIVKYLQEADLIISHAGSGTLFEALRLPEKKRIIAVCNQTLLNNHQFELATKLSSLGYLTCCLDTKYLLDAIDESLGKPLNSIQRLPKHNPNIFTEFLTKLFSE